MLSANLRAACFTLAVLLAPCGWRASAQATPTIKGGGGGKIQVGLAYSTAATDVVAKRIGGFSVYGTYSLLPHFALEGDIHLLQYFTPEDYAQRTYLGGGRLYYRLRRYEPYVKFLGGLGQTVAQKPNVIARGTPDSYGVFSGGGGLDIFVGRKWVVRAVDFEKQTWPAFPTHDLAPSILSFGVAYRLR